MKFPPLMNRLRDWVRGDWARERPGQRTRGPMTHVIILDGTMSSLEAGLETNAGHTYRLLSEAGAEVSVYYEAGLQFTKWAHAPDVLMGRGINRQIRRAYGYLASRYRPGDRIFMFGYSRGAYAVRSLAGVIDRIGLVTAKHATVRNIRQAYRHYSGDSSAEAAQAFSQLYCHPEVEIEMMGVWDTVKALGVRLPFIWKWSAPNHDFHNHRLGRVVRHGFHALALNETRVVYRPILWETEQEPHAHIEQVWFRGTHGDVGGQINNKEAARPLANIPLVWMLEKAEHCGLPMPAGWHGRFPRDVTAPSVGTWRGWAKLFWIRKKRVVGSDSSEEIHETVDEYRTRMQPQRWFFWRQA